MTNEEMFKANTKLAYKITQQYKNCGIEYDDLKQLCLLGLWEAVITYNKDKGTAFSTYSYRVIQNELNKFLRKNRKHFNNKSFSEEIRENITIEDVIADERDYIDEVHTKIENNRLKQVLFENLYNFKPKQQKVCMLMLKEKKQQEIADEIGVSQTQVSRIERKIKTRLLNLAKTEGCL